MIDVNALRGVWISNGMTQEQVAKDILGCSANTLSQRLRKGVLSTTDVEKLIKAFGIENPMSIFFA